MTKEQKKQTTRLRNEGFSYNRVADLLGLPLPTVKTFCRRNGLTGTVGFGHRDTSDEHFCLCCGLPVTQNKGRKEKKFCSDKCRNTWWNAHLDLVSRKTFYILRK